MRAEQLIGTGAQTLGINSRRAQPFCEQRREAGNAKMQKEREQWQVERFKTSCPEFPQGCIVPNEEPDFLIEEYGAMFGIELVGLYRADSDNRLPRQALESLRKQIVERAQRLYEEAGGPELWVSVHFSPYANLGKSRIPDLADRLEKIVVAANVGVDGNVSIQADWDTPDDFPEEIDSIHIRRLQILTKGFWTVPGAAFVPECTLDEVQRVIDKKNKRVASYRNKCDVIWLVIVVDGFALSSTVNFSDEVCEYLYRSDFDRVFIFENAAERSFELKTAIHSNQIL